MLEHFFLGSQGKRVGSLYAGADDITLYTPKFDSELTYSCPAYGFTRIGPFETSVCFPERVARQDWFNGNPYTYYAGGDYPIATITNHKNPDGPRVVLLRDSFACALTPFLALSCSELTTIDLRYFEGGFAGHHRGPGAGYSPSPSTLRAPPGWTTCSNMNIRRNEP